MRYLLVLLFLIISAKEIKSNPYAMALNRLKADSTFEFKEIFNPYQGLLVHDSIIVAVIPNYGFSSFQFLKYDLKGKSFRELDEAFTKDSIWQVFKNLGRKNYFSPQLKEVKDIYKQETNRWEMYFYEPEKYNEKVYLVALLCRDVYLVKPPYNIRPRGEFAQIIWVFNKDMTEILKITYTNGTME